MNLSIILTCIFGFTNLNASAVNDINWLLKTKKVSIYGIKSEDKKSNSGMGLFYNTHNLKLKVEGSDAGFKTAAVGTYRPFKTPSLYMDIGANYINSNLQENSSINNSFDQYSSAFAIGYMLYNNLYVELGENISTLNDYPISQDDKTTRKIQKDTYVQIGKRFETPIGTIDTHLNNTKIYNTLNTKEENYESNVNYYLNDAIKVGYSYSIKQDQTCNGYSLNLNYFSTEYLKNIDQDSYNVTFGIKANFTDITDLSTYKPLHKVKKHLTRAKKFDNLVLHDNMNLRK